MFNEIKKEYKKSSRERKFNIYYYKCAIIIFIIIVSLNFKLIWGFLLLTIFIIKFFINDYRITMKDIARKERFSENVKAYENQIQYNHINNLVNILKSHDIKTKENLKLTLDHFNNQRTVKIESSFLGSIASLSLTLFSFIEIAYDEDTNSINWNKLRVISENTFGIVIIILFIIIPIKLILNQLIFNGKELQEGLTNDLTYIYIHFDKYKNKLNSK